jgi:predicted phage-related endonuclease
MALTEKQKADRENKVGSSDAPIIAGVSPYKSPLELLYQFRGVLPRYTEEETEYQKIGAKLEPVIAELVADKLGVKYRRCPVAVHPSYPWCVSHQDFDIVGNPKGPAVFEIKNRSGIRPWEQVPDDVEVQVRHQMMVKNREWAIVGAMFQFGMIKSYIIERDKETEACLIELELRFLAMVAKKEAPLPGDWGTGGVDLLKRLYPRDSGRIITLDSTQALVAASVFQSTRAEIKSLEAQKEAAEGFLKDAMRDASEAVIPGFGNITWRAAKDGEAKEWVDLDLLKKDYPDAAAKCISMKPGKSGGRRFLLKEAKGLTE